MSRKPKSRIPTYDGGMPQVLRQMEGRRDPFQFGPNEALPPLDVDLKPLKTTMVLDPDTDPNIPKSSTSYIRKLKDVRREFIGKPELCALHGILVANLRRRSQPDHCAALFARLWAEEQEFLIQNLDLRWQVSAITTFGDAGLNEVQRRVGHTLTVLFNTMKLYESERLYSGYHPDTPFTLRGRARETLPMNMDSFAIDSGGLDVNMIGRLWQDADGDEVIKPLAQHLLDELIHDPRTVFRRLRIMRARRQRRKEQQIASAPDPSWDVVTLGGIDTADLLRFAAHYLDQGATMVHIYLDKPNQEAAKFLTPHPAIKLTACDPEFWLSQTRQRPDTLHERQAIIANHCYTQSTADWVLHVGTGEFLVADAPIGAGLKTLSADTLCAQIPSAELLASDMGQNPDTWQYFRKAAVTPDQKRSLQTTYPNFVTHLDQGMMTQPKGRVFARTGVETMKLGPRRARMNGKTIAKIATVSAAWLAVVHTPSWQKFMQLVTCDAADVPDNVEDRITEILTYLHDQEGEDGLRMFYSEVCEASPQHLSHLKSHGLLQEHDLRLNDKVRQVFGGADKTRMVGE